MNQRLFSVLIFAFVVSAGASLLLYRLIASRVTANAKQPTTQVIVAARTMELGTLIRDSDLKMGDWPGTLPKGSVLRKEDVVGRGVMAQFMRGAGPREPSSPQGRGRRSGSNHSRRDARRGGARQRSGGRGRICRAGNARRYSNFGNSSGRGCVNRYRIQDAPAEHRGSVGRTKFSERRRGEAGSSASGKPAGHAGTGGNPEPGEQRDQDTADIPQSPRYCRPPRHLESRWPAFTVVRSSRLRRPLQSHVQSWLT